MAPLFIIVSLWGTPAMRLKTPDGMCETLREEILSDVDRSFADSEMLNRLKAEAVKLGHSSFVRSDVRVFCTRTPPIIKHPLRLPKSLGDQR